MVDKEKRRVYNHQYYQEHKEQISQQNREYNQRLRLKALSHYSVRGVIRCARCGTADIDTLAIDHIDGNGAAHRRELSSNGGGRTFYHWLQKTNYPEGYQVLCYNCNIKKFRQQQREGKE